MARIAFEVAGSTVTPETTSDSMHRAVLTALARTYQPKLAAIICGIHKKEPTVLFKAPAWESMTRPTLTISCCCTTVYNRCMRAIESQ